jgi:atypical dual specificity phosphatase
VRIVRALAERTGRYLVERRTSALGRLKYPRRNDGVQGFGWGFAVDGFYWLIPGVLAGSGRPGGRRGDARLESDLSWLHSQGIGAILTLTEGPLELAMLDEHEFATLHLPVADLTPPTPEQLGLALAFIDRQRALDRPVLVHCLVGQGRTGTVLAAYLIRSGHSPEQAISLLREVCPQAVDNELQLAALATFAAQRAWLV